MKSMKRLLCAALPATSSLALLLGLSPFWSSPVAAQGARPGKITGRVIASDTGEPMAYVDVLLIPADSTASPRGTMSNDDGTYELVAPPGTYTLQIRMLSYTTIRVAGVIVAAGETGQFNLKLEPDAAIIQEEIVVEARAILDNESALLAQRRKAGTVGDAVSAEQVSKSPDDDAGQVLRRVTGLSVAEGKYVYVRGLGERYSSTEVDGVRLVSPEQNKRVVPLDLLPTNLLENVVVQKTYTADRPGEFGGGDVQVHTKDFPGGRTFNFSVATSSNQNTTFERNASFNRGSTDFLGFAGKDRNVPDIINQLAGSQRITPRSIFGGGFSTQDRATMGAAFTNTWSSNQTEQGLPSGSYSATFGDEWNVLGERTLGLITTANFRSGMDSREERRLTYRSSDVLFDYDVTKTTWAAQLGGMAGLSMRLSPGNSIHFRSLYNKDAEDELRIIDGDDVGDRGRPQRGTRLRYVERTIFSNSLGGRHQFRGLGNTSADWKLSLSSATRDEPDRRESLYEYKPTDSIWVMRLPPQGANREFGKLEDKGWGANGAIEKPFRLGALGSGAVKFGGNFETKDRESLYRRFQFVKPRTEIGDAPPESLFADDQWDGTNNGALLEERTFSDDNYDARQEQVAGFVSAEVPFGARVRAVLGVRVEKGTQTVRTFALDAPQTTVTLGDIDETDILPSANITLAVTTTTNLRFGASRTVSRPDLREMCACRTLEFAGDYEYFGNPDLKRARLDNYDVRLEMFPGLSEVLAVGGFYKRLYSPIEVVLRPSATAIYTPANSREGRNAGLELEARSSLGRVWSGMNNFFINTNYSLISSSVKAPEFTTQLSSAEHPLQGQALQLFNAALSYTSPGSGFDATVLVSHTGERLKLLNTGQPDIYDRPVTTLDATLNLQPLSFLRLKLSGENLADAEYRAEQGDQLYHSYKPGRGFSVGLSYANL